MKWICAGETLKFSLPFLNAETALTLGIKVSGWTCLC